LVGKTLHQFEFVLIEGPYLAATDDHYAQRLALPRKRRKRLRPYRQASQHARDFSGFICKLSTAISERDLAIVGDRAYRRVRWFEREVRKGLSNFGYRGACRTDDAKDIAFDTSEIDVGNVEHARGRLCDCIECALTILGRAGDDSEDIGSCRLSVETFA
jgi:hypothetical protein